MLLPTAYWGTSKQHMTLQQPRNYDFQVSPLNLPRSQSGNDREMTTSPPSHHREANIVLRTTGKLQQLRANNREMTTLQKHATTAKCNDRETTSQRPQQSPPEWHEILRCFVAVDVSSAFRKSLTYSFPYRQAYRSRASTQSRGQRVSGNTYL